MICFKLTVKPHVKEITTSPNLNERKVRLRRTRSFSGEERLVLVLGIGTPSIKIGDYLGFFPNSRPLPFEKPSLKKMGNFVNILVSFWCDFRVI